MLRRLSALTFVSTIIALSMSLPIGAHLVSKPRNNTQAAIHHSQAENLAHARYVCSHGKNYSKWWHCKTAHGWLQTEWEQTLVTVIIRPKIKYLQAWLCIHNGEGSWVANTGNGYYGGLQMDWQFMQTYGGDLLNQKGPANNWTPYEQMMVAERAHDNGRGFYPWPNTARKCGLI